MIMKIYFLKYDKICFNIFFQEKRAIHDCTVATTFEGMLYHVKLARPLPGGRNRPVVLQKRADYATWFMRHAVVNHSIFLDECGFNIWTARSHGQTRMGEKACGQACRQFLNYLC